VCLKHVYWLSENLVPPSKVHAYNNYTGAIYVNACVNDLHSYVYSALLNVNAGLVCTYKVQNRST